MNKCRTCKGTGTQRRYVHPAGWTTHACGACGGSGVEPELSLRELRALNQQRIRRERYGDS